MVQGSGFRVWDRERRVGIVSRVWALLLELRVWGSQVQAKAVTVYV